MDNLKVEDKIDFAKELARTSFKDSYDYLCGIFEENKNISDEKSLLKVLLLIIEYHQYTNPDEDIRYFFNTALEYAIKNNDNESIILLYRYYCQVLYKNAKLNQCEIMIQNYFSNFKDYSTFQNNIKLKEIEIAITGLTKENTIDEDSFFDLLNEEMDPDQIIKIIVSYSRKFISSLSEKDIIKLFNIFELGFEYIIKNRNHFKYFHLSYAELHNLIANLYYYFGLFKRAQSHFLRAFMESISQSEIRVSARYQKNIAVTFYELGQIDKANKYFEIIEKLYKKIDDPIVLNQFYSVLGLSYIRDGKYSLGHSLLKSAIKYRMSIKDYFTLLHTLNYAIIFSLFRDNKDINYYYLYFEKIVTQIPESYYYLYYILYKSILRNKKFDEKLFLENLIKSPIFSLRLIPLFSLCLKYKINLAKKTKFLILIQKFRNNFEKEISRKYYLNFANQFFEYSEIYQLNIEDDLKIKDKMPFKRIGKNLELNWNDFVKNQLKKQKLNTLLNLLYLKLSEQNTLIEYQNKKYSVDFIYNNRTNSSISLWAEKILFSRLSLKKIILKSI